jgi:hypothetical protein
MPVETLQERPDDGQPMPAVCDHQLARTPYTGAHLGQRSPPQLVLALAAALPERDRTPQTDLHLGMHPQPDQLGLVAFVAAAPARTHDTIMRRRAVRRNPAVGGRLRK